MIPPLDFYWNQLDGPQAKAYMQGIYNYFVTALDPALELLSKMGFDDIYRDYLNTVGAILGIGRPPVNVKDKEAVVFTELHYNEETHQEEALKYTKDNNRGYVDLDDPTYGGGQFTDSGNPIEQKVKLSDAAFRSLLKTVAESKGHRGSLVLLDDITYVICRMGSGALSPRYTITILTEDDPKLTEHLLGDVVLNLGLLTSYIDPYLVEGSLRSILRTQFKGLPKVWLRLEV